MYDKLQEKVDVLSHKLNSGDISLMEEAVVELNSYLSHENGWLQELADVLQEKHRVMSQEFSKLQERVETAESRVSVLETTVDDLQWDIDTIRKREQRLNHLLANVLERIEEKNEELEENKELAGNRLKELEELRQDFEEITAQNEKLKVELQGAVEEAVKETPEYRRMQSQFSVLYDESLQLKAHLDEARTLLHGTCTTHQRTQRTSGTDREIKQEPDDPSAQVSVPKAAFEDVHEMKARRDEKEQEQER
ncbi:hypothetical protein DUI87_25666 [Hirundo rustica rustica]|uniref:E3 ubiquitin protein ligase n=1 Tax=Hirundo rustica rustica TaxID=333673 RepID=A0A3M0JGF0_HIRRU|nr:hypothetical protein DUI87_25666 [Hirundo rustica rustica]